MEIEAVVFLGAVIAGVTQAVKLWLPGIAGKLTIVVAVAVGVLVALVDTEIGVQDISVAQGILTALGTVGVVTVADRV